MAEKKKAPPRKALVAAAKELNEEMGLDGEHVIDVSTSAEPKAIAAGLKKASSLFEATDRFTDETTGVLKALGIDVPDAAAAPAPKPKAKGKGKGKGKKEEPKPITEANGFNIGDPVELKYKGVIKTGRVKAFRMRGKKKPTVYADVQVSKDVRYDLPASQIYKRGTLAASEKKAAKSAKAKAAAAKTKAERGPSAEELAYQLVKDGAKPAQIKRAFQKFYKAKGKEGDDEFIVKRIAIYMKIATRRVKKEKGGK